MISELLFFQSCFSDFAVNTHTESECQPSLIEICEYVLYTMNILKCVLYLNEQFIKQIQILGGSEPYMYIVNHTTIIF